MQKRHPEGATRSIAPKSSLSFYLDPGPSYACLSQLRAGALSFNYDSMTPPGIDLSPAVNCQPTFIHTSHWILTVPLDTDILIDTGRNRASNGVLRILDLERAAHVVGTPVLPQVVHAALESVILPCYTTIISIPNQETTRQAETHIQTNNPHAGHAPTDPQSYTQTAASPLQNTPSD